MGALCSIPLLGVLATCTGERVLEVDIAAIGYLANPLNLGALIYNAAPMEMAIEDMNSQYNDTIKFNLDLVYDARHSNCSQYLDDAVDVAARWYYRKRRPQNVSLSVVVSPGKCKDCPLQCVISKTTHWMVEGF